MMASVVQQFQAVLWKNVCIQGIKRHYVTTGLEFAIVALCFWFDAYINAKSSPLTYTRTISYPPKGPFLSVKRSRTIVYGPPSDHTTFLVDTAFPFSETSHFGSASDIETISVASWAELLRKCKSDDAICFFVHSSSDDVNFNYTCYFVMRNHQEFNYKRQLTFSAKDRTTPLENQTFMLQSVIEHAHLEWVRRSFTNQSGSKSEQYRVYTKQFPRPSVPSDGEYYRIEMAMFLVAAFVVPFCVHVSTIVAENASGLKEMLGIMGLHEFIYWLGHFCTFALTSIISCVVVLYFLVMSKSSDTGRAILNNADPSLVAVALFMFSLMSSMHTILVACVFNRSSIAVTFSLIYWIPLTYIAPWVWAEESPYSISSYLFTPRINKLLSSVTPCLGTHWILKIISLACDAEGGARWELVTRRVLGWDNVTVLEIWSVMAATTFLVIPMMIWYLTRVLPWVTGIPQPFYFPFMISYWRPPSSATSFRVPTNRYFEKPPKNLEAAVNIRGLRKHFGATVVLDGIDWKFYNGEITVLLGHNGAGKTTLMNILTGLTPPTDGSVTICGYDIVKNTRLARKNIGLCPQFDVFFDDLTVWEHLVFFGTVRGISRWKLKGRAAHVIKMANLKAKAKHLAKTLSGGMKRRLSVAIATISRPKVIVLDEPSSGLDPETRREMWDLFLGMRNKCSLLLSTHDMEEADVLGDRIAIMSQGKIRCWGAPVFLKKTFGTGYQMSIEKMQTGLRADDILAVIQRTVPEAEITSRTLNGIKVSLRVNEITGFQEMFDTLERNSNQMGIKNIGVSISTMEDVYIKVNLEEGIDAIGSAEEVAEIDLKQVCGVKCRKPTARQRFGALLSNRWLHYRRVWPTPLVGILVPLLIFWCDLALEQIFAHTADRSLGTTVGGALHAKLGELYPSAGAFLQYDASSEHFTEGTYRPLVESEVSSVNVFYDAEAQLLDLGNKNFETFVDTYILGASSTGHTLYAWWSPYYELSRTLSLNLLNTALLRTYSGDPLAHMSLSTVVEVNEDAPEATLPQAQLSVLGVWIRLGLRLVFFPLGSSFIIAAAVLFPVLEKTNQCKSLQLMSGISSTLFWSSHLFFDTILYVLTWIAVMILYSTYTPILPETGMAALAWAIASAFLTITLTYCFSLGVETQSRGFTALVLLYSVGVPYSLIKLLEINFSMHICISHYHRKTDSGNLLDTVCEDKGFISASPGMTYCCAQNKARKGADEILQSPFTLDDEGILSELIIMLLEGLLAYIFICVADSGALYTSHTSTSEPAKDGDVERERKLVDRLYSRKKFSAYSLVVRNLQKELGTLRVIRGLSFTINHGECFGLLGVNGAGKTTTFQLLTGLMQPTSGEAYMDGLVMSKHQRQWQSNIGYCTQQRGLHGKLNAYESLFLYARLRGIPEKQLPPLVESMIRVVDLVPHAHNIAESYSGGSKRKLSMAIAMIGLPTLVFLDEPTAGVDVVARRKIFAAVQDIREESGISIILTSHSMDECEAVCDRIAIMVEGQFQCLGTLQHLKRKFGRGCLLTVKVADKDESLRTKMETEIGSAFPGIHLKEYHQGVFEYQMDKRLEWSQLFRRIETLQKQFNFEHVLVSDTSLEQIFIWFAKKNQRDVKVDGGATRDTGCRVMSPA
ncbi:phospholipid-transporting ATPase ABCA3-like isoform X2 [Ornithodoros turicata]|uniref:phospholipid-transporting ATPase ABCA3-like isoform X2 n=1 Tax=Ornithodoros turicata TaxID=34597 RepID=UPI0031389A7E